jgi:short-subunit dehydrogenase
MKIRGQGRVLVTGSIAGYIPGSYQAVYNASKAYLDSLSFALNDELREHGVTVTCLMPGPVDTPIFERADMEDSVMGSAPVGIKDTPEHTARLGYEAMKAGPRRHDAGADEQAHHHLRGRPARNGARPDEPLDERDGRGQAEVLTRGPPPSQGTPGGPPDAAA